MARVSYLDVSDLEPDDQDLLHRPINLFRALAHSPGALREVQRFGHWIRFECQLDARLRELAIIQVGLHADNDYEVSHHIAIGLEFGLSPEDVGAIPADARGEATHLSELDRLVLISARQLAERAHLPVSTWEGLAAHLDKGRLVDLIVVITHYAQVVRLLAALDVDVEDDFLPFLDLVRRDTP